MTDQEHVMHQMVNGRCLACVAAGCDEVHFVGGAGARGASSAIATGTGGYGNSHERRYPTTVACAGGGGGNVGDPVDITVTDKQWSKKTTKPLMSPISCRIMPGIKGQITIHLECQADPDRWMMLSFTPDDWDTFKRTGDLMFDQGHAGGA